MLLVSVVGGCGGFLGFGFRVVFRLLDWFGLGLVLSLFWFEVICWCLLVVLLDW